MLANTSLPLPLQGISQKEDDLKNPMRVKEQVNMFSSDARGLTRRLPFTHVDALKAQSPIPSTNSKTRMLTASLGNFELIIGDGVAGIRHNQRDLDPINYQSTAAQAYVENVMSDPENGKLITLGDSFILLDKGRPVLTKTDTSYRVTRTVVWVKNMEFGRTISVYKGSTKIGSWTSPNGEGENDYQQLAPSYVINEIENIITGHNIGVSQKTDSVMSLLGDGSSDLRIEDGKGNTLVASFRTEVASTEDLPPWCQTNTQVIVNPTTKEDSKYYVYFNGETWEEDLKKGERYQVESSTMPIRIYRDITDTWYAEELDWTVRRVGDLNTHPFPRFAQDGNSITDIFTYKERLGIVTGSSVEFSRVNDYTDFASLTARDSLDDDPIKLRATSTSSSQVFRYSTVLDKYCVLLTDHNIFILGSGVEAPFTPSTAQLNNIFTSSEKYLCAPEIHGNSLLTCSGTTHSAQINQLFIDAYGSFVRNPCLTDHVPSYISKNPYKILSSYSSDIFFVFTEENPNDIFVCQLKRNTEGGISQLAWHKWEVGQIEDSLQYIHKQEILTSQIYDNHLYITFLVNKSWLASTMSLRIDDVDLKDVIYLDHQVLKVPYGTHYIINDDYCGWSSKAVLAYTGKNIRQGYTLKEASQTFTHFNNGVFNSAEYHFEDEDIVNDVVVFGVEYESKVTTGRVYPRDQEGNVLHNIKMQLRWFNVNILHSGFHYTVSPDAREPRTWYKQPRAVSRYTREIEQRQYYKGIERVLVGADSRAIDFEFKAHEHHPLAITSLEAAHYSTKRGA